MREPPPRAVTLETRGSQFDFALNSRRTVENAADRGAVLLLLMPAAVPIDEAGAAEMLRNAQIENA